MPAAPVPAWVCATLPKRGNRAAENEDAAAAAPDALRFALADGATEGWESGPWAAHLAAAYTRRPPEPATFADWSGAVRAWAPPPREAADGNQPWYVTEKQHEGSFATLLGVELRRSRRANGWNWRSVAVGDSCLFHVRAGALVLAFPLGSAAAFGNRPALVASSPAAGCPAPAWAAGRAAAGDLLLLATDAAAARLFDPAARRAALRAAAAALAAHTPDALTDWCRGAQDAANDDVTVLAVRLPAAA
jgi:hypothetical protein